MTALSPSFRRALKLYDQCLASMVEAHQAAKLAAHCSLAVHLYREKGMQDMKNASLDRLELIHRMNGDEIMEAS